MQSTQVFGIYNKFFQLEGRLALSDGNEKQANKQTETDSKD